MKIVVVGGGTAGWLSALYSKKVYPEYDVTLIESEEIGILGAGEGSIPLLINCFDFLEIPFSDLVKNCNATVKNGIKFTNWSKQKKFFFHPFESQEPFSNDYNFDLNNNVEQDISYSHIYAHQFNHDFEEYVWSLKISNKNLVPFVEINQLNDLNPILNFNQIGYWSLHFDAKLLAEYLKKIALERGINRIEGLVKKINVDENEYIKNLELENLSVDVDFVFDCTGFKRLIIGNFYKSKWISFSNTLPAKKAIPFFLPVDKKIPPYTEAIAMNYGWMWKIPLQNRYGCGYVFDSDFISDDEAKKEIDNYLGFEVESPKTFSFNAGCYEKIFIKNCISVGLSGGFLEPLEATSIWQFYRILQLLFSSYGDIKNKDEFTKLRINEIYLKETQEIVDFLYLHYITDKDNTSFWKNFKTNNLCPEFIEYVLEKIKYTPLQGLDFLGKYMIFSNPNYWYILTGNNIVDHEKIKMYYNQIKIDKTANYFNILQNQRNYINNLCSHDYFIKKMKEEN